jgi:integrase/recombinase XerD
MKKRQVTLACPAYVQLLGEYNRHINILGYSIKSNSARYGNVLEFLTWLERGNTTDIKTVTTAQLKQYYEHLKNRPHYKKEGILSIKTVHHHMQNLRQLFSMLQASGAIIKNPMSIIKYSNLQRKNNPRTILSIAEIKQLYQASQTMQERAILSLAYGCGLRAMELVAVNTNDILFSAGIIIVPKGKGNKRRVIPLSPQVNQDIENYINHERPLYTSKPEEKALLLNTKGVRLREYTSRKILTKIIERSGNQTIKNKNIAIHNLRHSIATHLLEQGVPVEHVRTFLGHSHLETTEIYTRVNKKQLKELINLK